MPITYGDTGTNRTLSQVVYGDGGVNRVIQQVWYGDGGTNRLVFSFLSASAPPIGASGPVGTNVIGSSTCSVSGGIGPFTYAWSITSGSGFSISGAATATVTATNPSGGPASATGTLQCIVTDTGTGGSVTVSGVAVTLDHV